MQVRGTAGRSSLAGSRTGPRPKGRPARGDQGSSTPSELAGTGTLAQRENTGILARLPVFVRIYTGGGDRRSGRGVRKQHETGYRDARRRPAGAGLEALRRHRAVRGAGGALARTTHHNALVLCPLAMAVARTDSDEIDSLLGDDDYLVFHDDVEQTRRSVREHIEDDNAERARLPPDRVRKAAPGPRER